MITTQALMPIPLSTLNPAILAPRPGLKPKPLAERSLFALQLIYYDLITMTTIDSLLAQFKSNVPTELDSDSNSYNKYRQSYTQEQKLVAIGYTIIKQVYQKGEIVPILYK